ncbi:type I-B CRISPR-associated endonuclease Cas1 [Campylobacter fetus]|uniref:CRISPR-associated endonuclease Cas1 n=2 Tax=Campylobacter fetus TaxID=196 RepID=A0A5L8JKG7_CAMFE|nr:type I-B CRISPR-associated endonuclease Cas1b [Campylobacter fetus]EAI3887392.1 type I-B CRISPR-associated endonuclease Cas1 [Campylobacter fetus]EAI3916586.1 type I-B CRISPR-associated endonuclease Cas1 [Campylobacter fetus]EAI3920011.1 type I-B CRISPR-associated endonuclease Cas1 [Campylobacter fetus]EAI8859961.1 type I-B CRISPR-associated endonuclease Cas1 [Campylobacter fetus]EAJ0321782.1 type I-B CRISPR-associated endonuclease Cas1 [Campylobacter fetus]
MSKLHTRYIFSMGELSRKDNSLAFKNEKGTTYIPIAGIREIYCMNEVSINSKLLDFLAKNGITIHFFNYYGNYSGSFYPKKHLISGRVIISQVEALANRMIVAKSIVKGIALNMHEVLYHYYRHGKTELKPLLDYLKFRVSNMLINANTIPQIMFIEGQIWSKFYDSFELFLDESFSLGKRVKRPPDNPMNAMISFGNSLLYTKTISAIYQTHLEQSISYLHESSDARFSLSLDLSEVFKPIIVFKTVFELVNLKKINIKKHFEKKIDFCLLNESGRKIFVESFEERLNEPFLHSKLNRKISYKTALKLEGYKLIKFICESREFVPFSLKDKR